MSSVLRHSAILPARSATSARALRLACSLLLSISLAGCLAADPPDPRLDIPTAYQAGPRNPEAALPKVDWWRGFHSAELTSLVEEARIDNLDIAAAVARIDQADAAAQVTGASLLPTLDGGSSTSRSRNADPGGPVAKGRNQVSLSLSASYELDFWGKNRAALLAEEDNAEASRFDRDTVELTALTSVAMTYFDLVAAQDRLQIARENVTAASRVLNLVRQRLNAGTATALDEAEQQSVVGQQKASIPPLEQIIEQDRATLAVLVGRAPERLPIVGGSMNRLALPRVTPGLPSDILTQRPDVREAEATLASAHANVVSARAAFFPTIGLTAQGGVESLALKSLFEPSSVFYSIAANLTQPIFDGGVLQGQFAQSKGVQAEQLANYRKAVISAFSDVEKALVAIRQLTRQEALQRDVVESSSRAYQLSEQQLREGTTDLVTVLQTQQTLFQAQSTLVEVRLSRFQAFVSLYSALGGGWGPVDITVASRH